MSKQESDFPRRERFGMRMDFMLRRRVIIGISVALMCASLVSPWETSAHNIDPAKAREVAREYARSVREEGHGYIHYSTSCRTLFPGHNHYVRCEIEYQNEKETKAGVYTCKESLDVFMAPHGNRAPSYSLFAKHASSNYCGDRRLNGVNDPPR
ncbi:MAG: hypothetical protein ACJ741_09885 [Pyrinomonadaceae bacterium]